MAKLILMSVLVCSMVGSARAQCCGDCNGDGTVTINELITAVNNALVGCGGATPTLGRTTTPTRASTPTRTPTPTRKPTNTSTPSNRCPLALTDTSGTRACGFNGTYNRGCGSALNSVLTSTGTLVTVAVGTMLTDPPVVYFGGEVQSATSASLVGWSTDGFQTINPTAGTIQLTDNGSQLVVFPNDFTFQILGCSFVQYIGTYTGSGTVLAQRAPLAREGEPIGAVERLRAWLERPIPDLAAH